MGAEIDRLEVQVEAEAKDANKQLDDLAANLGLVAKALSSLTNVSGFKELTNISKQAAGSMSEISAQAQSVSQTISKSMGNAEKPMRQVSKTASEIAEKYKDLGKDFQFFGSVESAQKQIEKYSNALETAKLKKTELEATGKTEGKMYENAIKDIQKYSNMIDALKTKTENATEYQAQWGSQEEFDNWYNGLHPLEAQMEQVSENIKESFRQVNEPLKELDLTLADFSMKAAQAFDEPQKESGKLSENLEVLKDVAYGIQERFLELKGRLENIFVSKGLKTYTSEHVELQNQVTKTEKTLATLNAQLARSRETVKGFEKTTSYRKMQYDIAQATAELQRLRNEQDKLETSGGATQWNFKGLSDGAKSLSKTLQPLYNTLKKVSDAASSLAKKILSVVSPFKKLKNQANGFHGSLSGGLKTILKYGIGIRSLYVLLNKLRSAITEGMKNLVQYSNETNYSVSTLSSSLTQLKNASAAMVSPLLNALAPALNQLIQMFVSATNAVNQFFAALTGQSTWIKAKYVYEDVADSISGASKAAKGALQPFDALNNLTTQDSSGAGVAPSDMFETLPIESKFKDLADWLKDMWDNADFYDLGKLLGEKLKKALESIPWNKIKKTLRKIAKSIATLLNGFLETPRLFSVIGKTIAEGINSAFEFLDEFVWDFHWDSLGQAIVDTIQGIIDNLDWDVISSAITGLAYGLADLFNTIFGATKTWGDLGTSIAKAINVALQGVYLFVHNFEWASFGTSVGTFLGNALRSIAWWKLGDILATGINGAFTALFNFCETFPWTEVADSIVYGINNALDKLDWEQIKGAIKSLANHLGEWINEFISEIDWEEVGRTIGGIIQLGLDFVYTLKDTIDWDKVKDAIYDVLKGAIENVDMGELSELILTLLAAKIVIKATPALFANVGKTIASSILGAIKGAFASSAAVESATAIGTSIGNSIMAGVGSVALVGGSYFALDQLSEHLEEVAEATGRSTDQARRLEERYDGFTGKLTGLKDAFITVKNGIEGYGFAADTVTGQGVALEKAMEDIANGAIYTDERMSELQKRFSFTDEDIEMLRQATLDANPELRNLADSFTALNGASAETLEEINAGLKNIEEGIVPADNGTLYLTGRFGELTEATKVFFDNVATGATSLDDYKTTLDDVATSAEEFGTKMSEAGENIGEGIVEGLQKTDIVSATQSLFNAVDQNIRSVFGIHSPASSMIPLGNNVGLGIVEGFSQGTASITTKIQELLSKFSSIAEPLRQAGVNAMQGFANGISSMAGTILSSARSIADNVTSTIKSALSIHSPSRVMFELGDYTMQGFQNGIESLYQPIISSIRSFGEDVQIAPAPSMESLYGNYQFAYAGIPDYNTNSYIDNSYSNDNSETNTLLRELLSVVREGKVIEMNGSVVGKTLIKEDDEYYKRTGKGMFQH